MSKQSSHKRHDIETKGKDSNPSPRSPYLSESEILRTNNTNHIPAQGETNKKLLESDEQLQKKIAQLDVVTRYLHNILNSISHGIVFVDLNGIVTTLNGAAEIILERDSWDILFSSYWDHFGDDYFGFSMREALQSRTAPETLFTNLETLKGNIRELELHTSFVIQETEDEKPPPLLEDYAELIQGIVIVMRDRTEINRLRHLANRNDRMKELGEIAASVAHEIRNPLGGIKGFASLLYRDLNDNPNLQQMAGHIIEGADNLNRLVTNVLSYARPIQLQQELTDLVQLVEELRVIVAAEQSPDAAVAFEVKTQKPTHIIPIDRQLLRSALLNLIINAVQAMPEGGTITASIYEKNGYTHVSIKDTGSGIRKENLEKIFSPFFTTKPMGNGFGLSEVHKVILAHEGSIDVSSEEGEGAAFTINLPSKSYVRK